MLRVWLNRNFLQGLLSTVLIFAVPFALTACKDESGLSSKKSSGTADANAIGQFFRGTVTELGGEAFVKTQDSLHRLDVGDKVFEKSKLTTETSSSLVVTASDGSVIKLEGKSGVELDGSMVDSLRQKVSVNVNYGKLLFDVQKQAVRDEFEIRSEKLVSIVRGTAGFMDNVDGLEVLSLKDGLLNVSFNGDSVPAITNGQTMIANANGVKLVSLSSSGTLFLAKAIDSIATDFSSQLGVRASKVNLDSLESRLIAFDENYKKNSESFIKHTQSEFKPMALSEYIGKPSVTLEALVAPGVIVTVMGVRDTVSESGTYKRTFEWDDSTAFGLKRFIVNCSNGEVEYICHTWNTNFVSAKMAELLTKSDERKSSVATKDSVMQPQQLKLAVVVEGSGRERIHVLPDERDVPATLRFSVTGLVGADLKQIKYISVKRKGKIIKRFSGDELTTNSFKLPIRLKQNRVAHFEVIVTFVNGKRIRAKKVYETYCYFDNYEDGKKSNRINDMSAEEEYKKVVSEKLLKNE